MKKTESAIIESISLLKEKLRKKINLLENELADKAYGLLRLIDSYKNRPVAFVFIGETCAGKTTLLNALITYLKLGSTGVGDYSKYQILKSSSSENTFNPTIIESSDNENYYVYEQYQQEKGPKIYYTEEGLEDLKEFFIQHNENSEKVLTDIKKKKANQFSCIDEEGVIETDLSEEDIREQEISDRISKTFIHLGIPYLTKNVNIVDLPGVSGDSIRDVILELLTQGAIVPIVVYVRSFENPKAIDEGIHKLLEDLSKGLKEVYLSVVFTKSDKLVTGLKGSKYIPNEDEEEEKGDIIPEDYGKTISNFLIEVDKLGVKTIGVDFINPKYALYKKPKQPHLDNISSFYKNIYKFAKLNKSILICCSLKKRLNDEIKTVFNGKHCFTEEEIKKLSYQGDEIIRAFHEYMVEYVRKFEKSSNELKVQKCDLYYFLEGLIKKNKEILNKQKTYFRRRAYLADQLKIIHPLFFEKIFKTDINLKMIGLLYTFYDGCSPDLQKKIYELTQENEKIMNSPDIAERFLLLYSLTSGVIWGLGRVAAVMVAEALTPIIGWIALGATVLYGVYSMKNYVGFWTYEGCKEDIVNSLLEIFSSYSDDFIESTANHFKAIVKTLVSQFKNARKETDLSKEFSEIIDKFNIKSNFSQQPFSKMFLDKVNMEITFNDGLKEFFKAVVKS